MNSKKLESVSSCTVCEDNNGAIVVATISRMNPTSNHSSVKYHFLGQHVGKEFVI